MPLFAAIPAVLGSIGAAAGVTGAGIAAGTSIAAGAAISGAALAAGLGIASSVSANAQAKKVAQAQANAQNTAANTPGTTVGDPTLSQSNNLGRAALISTSPSGVQGLDPTGRRSLLGN